MLRSSYMWNKIEIKHCRRFSLEIKQYFVLVLFYVVQSALLFQCAAVFSLTPPPEVHHVDVKPMMIDEIAPQSSMFSATDQFPLEAPSGGLSPSYPVKRKLMTRSPSSSTRLTLKLQQIKRRVMRKTAQLNNGRWRSASGSDVINNRCAFSVSTFVLTNVLLFGCTSAL